MKTKLILSALVGTLLLLISGCSKAGTGGNGTVICSVINTDNNNVPVYGATVYVKYGQSTPPSANNTGYDDHKVAAANSNTVTFTGLKQGTYYFYAEANVGTTANPAPVSGGNPFSLTHAHRNGTSNATIDVMY
jgi:hypothetical protein